MSPQLDAIAHRAKEDVQARFTALAHHLSVEFLEETWQLLNQKGAPGLSGETMAEYARVREQRIPALVETLKARAYRVPPVRRVYIPKPGQPEKRRPLGIPEVEDRLLQAAINRLLQPIYEANFLNASYGFRPGRSPHGALDALSTTLMTRPIQWVFEADIRGFFDHLQHGWLMQMLGERIGDPGILRLIKKWLHAPIVEPDGRRVRPTEGTPQGGPLSPLLGNVYLHYALDLWFAMVVQPRCRGEAPLIRFADDFVVLFTRKDDADRFATALPARLSKFGLELAPEKTRLIPFGRVAWRVAEQQGSSSERFDFLGFTHFGAKSRMGRWTLQRRPTAKSRHKFLVHVKGELHRLMHAGTKAQQQYLQQALRGYYAYFGYPGCWRALQGVQWQVGFLWYHVLRRRSQRSPQGRKWYSGQRWFVLPPVKLRSSSP